MEFKASKKVKTGAITSNNVKFIMKRRENYGVSIENKTHEEITTPFYYSIFIVIFCSGNVFSKFPVSLVSIVGT